MADIVNAPDLPSEDEEDDDYDPSRQGAPPQAFAFNGQHCALAVDLSRLYHTGTQTKGTSRRVRQRAAPRAGVSALWKVLKSSVLVKMKTRRTEDCLRRP